MEIPDFKSYSISELHFSARIVIPNEISEQIKKISPPGKEHDSMFYDKYGTGKNSYRGVSTISEAASESTKEGQPQRLFIHYRRGTLNLPRGKYAKIEQLIEVLTALRISAEFSCFLTFNYSKRDKIKATITLPLSISKSPGSPFNEVRGFHFAKTEGKKSIYEVILDHNEDGQLFITTWFSNSVIVDDKIISTIVNKSIEISNYFIFQEK